MDYMTNQGETTRAVVVYNVAQHVFEADDELSGAFKARVIPMPREIGNPCNHAILLEERCVDAYRHLVENRSPIAGVYLLRRAGLKAKARLLEQGEVEAELKKLS